MQEKDDVISSTSNRFGLEYAKVVGSNFTQCSFIDLVNYGIGLSSFLMSVGQNV